MISVEEKTKTGGLVNGAGPLLEEMVLKEFQDQSGARKSLNSELWHTCAGPLVSLPQLGSLVYYFPQGHSEQVAISTKRTVSSHIPNYPNLPSQLLCQVHNVTLHADKETDEIYAQMSLQPVNSEKDVFPVPDFGIKTSKHPSQFFCKTLTASDTSTHGGFSVPRRAAEKLFPQLDYSMQPPTQELVVRDLHDCTWTFRHIYRGQPKRHLLTTGWSSFVGAKRLRAGDTVLFIRDEKSQLLLGIRRANRQQTALPSSVLSADSMHIGVLAAAAHAAANRVPFTIFYNPRACPSEFVIPMAKYQKAVYGPQVSIGMRFGMMFETEESGKRRYMGTIVGISDLDPLRWPTSKWRNLQVEWDEPGSGEKQSRISLWDVETPESLFIFPSLTSSLKRSFHPGYAGADTDWMKMIKRPLMRVPENGCVDLTYPPIPNIASEQLIKMLLKPQGISTFGAFPSNLPACVIKNSPSIEKETNTHPLGQQNPQLLSSQTILPKNQNPPHSYGDQLYTMDASLASQKYVFGNFQPLVKSEDQFPTKSNTEKPEIETITSNTYPHQIEAPLMETSNPTSLLPYPSHIPLPYLDTEDWGSLSAIPEVGQEMWDSQMNYLRVLSQPGQITPFAQPNSTSLHGVSNSCGMRNFSEESNDQSEIFSDLHFDASNGGGSTVIDPSSSSAVLEGFSSMSDAIFQQPDCLMGNFSSNQDVQSQITSASLTDSHGFSLQEFPDSSGGTSSSNVDFDENSLLQKGLWQQISPPLRTYTKVQKLGSVGRSIDVTRFKNYEELRSAISCMFGLEGLLDDPRGSGWKLVYVDYENDVLLVGDDPWEEFVSCVRCIRILSPSEVEQMSENGMQLLNGPVMQQGNENSLSEDRRAWDSLT